MSDFTAKFRAKPYLFQNFVCRLDLEGIISVVHSDYHIWLTSFFNYYTMNNSTLDAIILFLQIQTTNNFSLSCLFFLRFFKIQPRRDQMNEIVTNMLNFPKHIFALSPEKMGLPFISIDTIFIIMLYICFLLQSTNADEHLPYNT